MRIVGAVRPDAPMPTAASTSSHGPTYQGRPSDAGTASAVSATPATAASRRISGGSASAAATVSSSALTASCQPAGRPPRRAGAGRPQVGVGVPHRQRRRGPARGGAQRVAGDDQADDDQRDRRGELRAAPGGGGQRAHAEPDQRDDGRDQQHGAAGQGDRGDPAGRPDDREGHHAAGDVGQRVPAQHQRAGQADGRGQQQDQGRAHRAAAPRRRPGEQRPTA